MYRESKPTRRNPHTKRTVPEIKKSQNSTTPTMKETPHDSKLKPTKKHVNNQKRKSYVTKATNEKKPPEENIVIMTKKTLNGRLQ
ncbi:22715_t:CDS:2 [Gigaspora rosea]|nr:22715_t:CDS:2 [Gigaspora rosea]